MRQTFIFSWIVFIFIALTSCSSYKIITIENQHPAKVSIPESIQSLTLMNRSMSPEYRNFQKDSLQNYFYKRGFQISSNVLDSLASDTCIQVLGDLLYESGRFDIVIPVDRNLDHESKFFRIEPLLSQDSVASICKTYNTDALLVLERMITQVNTGVSGNVREVLKNGDINYDNYTATIDIFYNTYFRLYDPQQKELVAQYVVSDSIFWDTTDINFEGLFSNLTPIKQALIETGIKIALDLDDKISPKWVKQNRGFFVLNKKDKKEQELISANEWNSLAEIWQQLTQSKNKNIKSKAEHNMALACELEGQIDEAISWLEQSIRTKYSVQSDVYIKQLVARQKELALQIKNITTPPGNEKEKGYLH